MKTVNTKMVMEKRDHPSARKGRPLEIVETVAGAEIAAVVETGEVAEIAAEAAGDDRGLASVLNTRAGTLFNLGELDEATELFLRVRALATRSKRTS